MMKVKLIKIKETIWNKYQIEHCIDYIENGNLNVQITLNDLLDICIKEFNFPPISISTLWNYLEEQLITIKLVTVNNSI